MQPLLANILWNRSPLVIGYSGWENDVIMTSLSRRLESDLRFNMYWFCYKYNDAFNVPEFLYENSQVFFVVPKPEDSQATTAPVAGNGDASSPPESSPPSGRTKRIKAASLTELNTVAKKQHDEFSLPADKVLVAMARKFELENPPLTKSPLVFFIEHLRDSLPKDPTYDNVFLFNEVIRRIKQADAADRVVGELATKYGLNQPDDESITNADFIAKLTAAMMQNGASPPVEVAPAAGESPPSSVVVAPPSSSPLTPASVQQVDEVLNALRSHRYVDAINLGKEIPVQELPAKQTKDLMDAMWQAALGLYDNSENELDGYDTVIKVGEHLIQADPANADACRLGVAKALFNKGRTFYAMGDYQKTLDVYSQVVGRFGDEKNDVTLREQVAKALLGKGATFDALEQHEAAIKIYDEVDARCGEATETPLLVCVGVALYNKGVALAELKRNDEAIETYSEMARRFGGSTESHLRKNVVDSYNNAGYLMLCEAKRVWDIPAGSVPMDANAYLDGAYARFIAAFQLNPDEPLVLGNLGYVSFLLGKQRNNEIFLKRAETCLRKAIAIGGEEIRQTELEDADRFPLPVDEEFKTLVRSIDVTDSQAATLNIF
jgi:tetratricopeptide (TPR) repeat protein